MTAFSTVVAIACNEPPTEDVTVELSGDAPRPLASDGRSYVTGYYALDLDGIDAGIVQKVEGGDVDGEVAVALGLPLAAPVEAWVRDLLGSEEARRSGSIVQCGRDFDTYKKVEFDRALLTEVTLCALDMKSKDPCWLTLKFTPEAVRTKEIPAIDPVALPKAEPLDLHVDIGGLAAAKVSKVDALTIKQTRLTDDVGVERDYAKEPGKIDFPNLRLTVPRDTKLPTTADHEKNGSLVYLPRNGGKELLRFRLKGLGDFQTNRNSMELEIEAPVESMELASPADDPKRE
jgi:hypothetical protein